MTHARTRRTPISARMAIAAAAAAALLAGCADHQPLSPSADDARLGRGVGPHGGGPPGSVVFYSNRDANAEIYRMNADGTDQTRLTFDPRADLHPELSPNGRRIVFISNRITPTNPEGDNEVFVMNADGTGVTQLTFNAAVEGWPRWSPNGKEIAFHSNRDGNFEIYVLDVRTGDQTRVTSYPGVDQFPEWSPNGKLLAFRRDHDVWTLDLRTGELTRLTTDPALDQMAAWSPSGKQLAFMSLREGYCAVFLMSADGSGQVNLTPKPAGDPASAWCSFMPSWSRNGKQIYFASLRPGTGGSPDIFVMDADGSDPTRLTSAPGEDGAPTMR